jgi:hypothetical protein
MAATRESASDVFDAANREAELRRTKAELAATQARLAVRESSAGTTATAAPATEPDLSRPPGSGLLMWFDAAKGAYADGSGRAAIMNGPAGQWSDLAAGGGNSVLQYTASSTRDREQNFPTLRMLPAGAGLKSPRPVISFDGTGDTLCIRDRDRIGSPTGQALDGGSVTVIAVFRAAGPDAPEGILTARSDRRSVMWSLGVKDRGLVASPGGGAPLRLPGTESEFRVASFTLDARAGNRHLVLISNDGQKVSSDTKCQPDKVARLEMLRMGTSDGSNDRGRSRFAGDLAELLIYNRALDRDSRVHAEDYLRLKFFGAAGPAIAAGKMTGEE